MSGNAIQTEGASGAVYTQSFALGAGLKQQLFPALSGSAPNRYRIVSAMISSGGNGAVYIYHGTTQVATKTVIAGIFSKGANPVPYYLGDWAAKIGQPNEPVYCDTPDSNVVLCIQYQLTA
jgi:hypothetical protein